MTGKQHIFPVQIILFCSQFNKDHVRDINTFMQVLVMDQNVKQHESGKSKADINIVMREMDNADDLRTHLQMHGGEKPNKCNQCDYASSRAG